MIKAGIVGLGRWGQRLVNAVSQSTEIQYVSAVTRSPDKAKKFCSERNIQLEQEYSDLLKNPSIDAIVLATPHSQHVDQIKAAAAVGKHVFVEKPFALDSDLALQAIQACEAQRVILAAGFNRRFLPAYQYMDQQLNTRELGQGLHIEGGFSGPFGFSYHPGMWRGTLNENPAGGMAAMGIHVLDAMIHLIGPVESVHALSSRQILDGEVDDTTSVMLKFNSGATGYLSTLMATAQVFRLQLYGSKGWLSIRDHETLEKKTIAGEITTEKFQPMDIERLEQDAFAKAITGVEQYPVQPSEILNGVATMEAITESALNDGQKVRVRKFS